MLILSFREILETDSYIAPITIITIHLVIQQPYVKKFGISKQKNENYMHAKFQALETKCKNILQLLHEFLIDSICLENIAYLT